MWTQTVVVVGGMGGKINVRMCLKIANTVNKRTSLPGTRRFLWPIFSPATHS